VDRSSCRPAAGLELAWTRDRPRRGPPARCSGPGNQRSLCTDKTWAASPTGNLETLRRRWPLGCRKTLEADGHAGPNLLIYTKAHITRTSLFLLPSVPLTA